MQLPIGPEAPLRSSDESRGQTAVLSRASITAAPARPPVRDQWGAPPPGYIAGRGRGATGFAGGVSRDDTLGEQDRADYSDQNFDEFHGYHEALFRDAEYDEEDRQADILYDTIEVMMDMRRRSRREDRLKKELAKLRAEKPTIHQQFADLKGELAAVTREEWDALPDIGDPSLRSKQKKPQRLQRAPDNLLAEAASQRAAGGLATPMTGGLATPMDGFATPAGGGMDTPLLGYASVSGARGMQTPLGLSTPLGLATPLGMGTPLGLRTPHASGGLGEAREAVLGVKLDNVIESTNSSSAAKSSMIDPSGYLTALQSMSGAASSADVVNIGKARSLMKSIVSTNPNNPQGWIAYARLEEKANRMGKARDVIAEGCATCPKEEEVWLEAARLHPTNEAKLFLTVAVRKFLPNSVRLWVERANRETDVEAKRRILRSALDRISNSVRLWKEAVALENNTNARLLLLRAVECVPQAVELWLKLARASNHEDARKALNEARKNCPTSIEVWVEAAELEESRGVGCTEATLTRLVANGLKKLKENDVVFDRAVWITYAEQCEAAGNLQSCRAIISAISDAAGESLEGQKGKIFKKSRLEEAEKVLANGRVETARAILTDAAKLLPTKKSIWLALVELEESQGNKEGVVQVLEKAAQAKPNKDLFWLMLAKHKWLMKDADGARRLLAEAADKIEHKEGVILALVKIERESGNTEEARRILARAREQLGTAAVWTQSVQLERQHRNYDTARKLVLGGLSEHPKHARLWMVAAAIELEKSPPDYSMASSVYEKALRQLPRASAIWECAIQCQMQQRKFAQARALREKANLCVPANEMIWLKATEIELADPQSTRSNVKHIMNRGIQDCPKSGLLWSEAIWLEEPAARSAKAAEAISVCDNHPYCVLAAAKLFWGERKEKKAREWFKKARDLGPRYGDIYGAHLAFEMQHKKLPEIRDLLAAATEANPNTGFRWNFCVKKVENWTKSIPEKLKAYVELYHPDNANVVDWNDAVSISET